ncbi:OmpA family protein [Pseudomonas multiresinivorans]|uniref:OmpA family protein n=1 Tax=Pseudomonas multiresinivorans TaxID=95301 RepID=A0A7Z3BRC5_9PSED|nr:OmpA family protein [Pseudomonas multiresinivorans]QJP11486.1 OmpA family protein [Pseudomonas multiresinivorans]
MVNSLSRPLRNIAGLSVLVVALGFATDALAQNDSIYGNTYSPVGSVVPEQAQVVLYRALGEGREANHVYVDGELQSALMPGGYTVFCLAPGRHSLETYVGDAPQYAGKRNPSTYADFVGGKSYFLKTPAEGTAKVPAALTRVAAEQELQGLRQQTHVLNRASATVACATATKLSLRGDVLFKFGKGSYNDLTAQGHAELRKVAQQIGTQTGAIESIEVVGHADPIGNAQANQRLSLQRAESVRRVLLELGVQSDLVQASGRGSSEPVVQCNSGSRSKRIACNAPNRRVELMIRSVRGDS